MANQNNILIGAASVAIDGVDVGYTQGGVTFRKASEYVDVDADQMGGVARKECTFERAYVNFTMLEVTLANMRRVMNEPASALTGSALNIGTASPAVQEHTLTLTGKGPTGYTRTYTFYRAVQVDDLEHMVGSREAPGTLPCGFECLKD